jgi:hypothetical protein
MDRVFFPVLLFGALLLPSGSLLAQTTDPMGPPDGAARLAAVKTIGILPPRVRIFELAAGGTAERRDEWSAEGRDAVLAGLSKALAGKGYEVRLIEMRPERKEEIEELSALIRATGEVIVDNRAGGRLFRFPPGAAPFAYSIGSLDSLASACGVDAFLFVEGFETVSSGGRLAIGVVGAFAGMHLPPGQTGLSLSVVDRSGAVAWFRRDLSVGPFAQTLRAESGAEKIVRSLLDALPPVAR